VVCAPSKARVGHGGRDRGHESPTVEHRWPTAPAGTRVRPGTSTARPTSSDTRFRRAIDPGDLLVQYQPVVRLEDGQIVGVEALARWPHPARGLLLPNEFNPFAENSGLVIAIDRLVLRRRCPQVERWNALRPGRPPLTVAVNLAASQLLRVDLVGAVEVILSEGGLWPNCLALEFTESLLLADDVDTVKQLDRLKSLDTSVLAIRCSRTCASSRSMASRSTSHLSTTLPVPCQI
jgi:predicted signal transduction protein with EAL and GGDEF domain